MATKDTPDWSPCSWPLGCGMFWSPPMASWPQPNNECSTAHSFGNLCMQLASIWLHVVTVNFYVIIFRNDSSKLFNKKASCQHAFIFRWTTVAEKIRINMCFHFCFFWLNWRYLMRCVLAWGNNKRLTPIIVCYQFTPIINWLISLIKICYCFRSVCLAHAKVMQMARCMHLHMFIN